jgi:hypothetical protein
MFIVCVSNKCCVLVSPAAGHGYRDLGWGIFFIFCIFGGGEEIELARAAWQMVMGGSNASAPVLLHIEFEADNT